MRKFAFSLERVLDYRKLVEQWAKEAFLEAQAKHWQAQESIIALHKKRAIALSHEATTLQERRTLESFLVRLDDEERDLKFIADMLKEEEEAARAEWERKRRDAEVLEKLRQKQFKDWSLEFNRWEQKQLDEWAVMRRKAS